MFGSAYEPPVPSTTIPHLLKFAQRMFQKQFLILHSSILFEVLEGVRKTVENQLLHVSSPANLINSYFPTNRTNKPTSRARTRFHTMSGHVGIFPTPPRTVLSASETSQPINKRPRVFASERFKVSIKCSTSRAFHRFDRTLNCCVLDYFLFFARLGLYALNHWFRWR